MFLKSTPGIPEVVANLFPNLPNFIAHVLSTIVIIIFLVYLVYKPFRKMISNRREKINELLNDAAQKQAMANKEKKDALALLNTAKTESKEIINTAKKDAEDAKLLIINKAKTEAGDIQLHAKNSIERERSEAKEEIRKNIIDLAFTAAEKIIETHISEKENKKLVEEFIDNLDK